MTTYNSLTTANLAVARLEKRIAELEGNLPFGGRTLRDFKDHSCSGATDYCSCQYPVVKGSVADLVCSDLGDGMHKPVIDIDLPCRLVESSPGKHHLYIDKAISWNQFHAILVALTTAGIVEGGYLDASQERGYTAVRHPNRLKTSEPISYPRVAF